MARLRDVSSLALKGIMWEFPRLRRLGVSAERGLFLNDASGMAFGDVIIAVGGSEALLTKVLI